MEDPNLYEHYSSGQVSILLSEMSVLLFSSFQHFIHSVFGYRGVVLFHWTAKLCDRNSNGYRIRWHSIVSNNNNNNIIILSTVVANGKMMDYPIAVAVQSFAVQWNSTTPRYPNTLWIKCWNEKTKGLFLIKVYSLDQWVMFIKIWIFHFPYFY